MDSKMIDLSKVKKTRNAPTGETPGLYGAVLRKYRIARKIDQLTIAKEFNLHPNSISNWERGIARPDLNYVVRLCEMLQMPITEFFGLEPGTELNDDEQQLINDYRSLPSLLRPYALTSVHGLREYAEQEKRCNDLDYYRQNYYRIAYPEINAAAGFAFPEEGKSSAKYMYVKASRNAVQADEIHTVNGHSMEPDFPNGSRVFVKRTTELEYGDVGIFMVDGEIYIKVYTPNGLKSLNTEYKLMRKTEYESICIIGKVLGPVDPESIAKGKTLDMCIAAMGK